jgi:hypothetical protein
MKNLVICPAGDNSIHESWNTGNKNFDTAILYYGDNDDVYTKYSNNSKFCIKSKGQKGKLLYEFISNNISEIINYDFIWQVDDDIRSSSEDVNRFFDINKKYDLWLSQPAISNHVSFEIEKKNINKILRFTNFVEILCPCFSLKTLLFLFNTYTYNSSSWGLDFLWPKLLNYPTNKIAIIDDVEVNHTKPIASGYGNRFEKEPMVELKELFSKFNLLFNQVCFGDISK